MNTKLQIKKDDIWVSLELEQEESLRYNKLSNTIEDITVRKISHSNTLSIPYSTENIQKLGLNPFNKSTLADGLNTKYEARYFIKDQLSQKGWLVINNTEDGTINVNFIDESLDLIDTWKSVTYRDFLRNDEGKFTFPTDIQHAIDTARGFRIGLTQISNKLNTIGSRGYGLALFPNNLNIIGDKFQVNGEDVKIDNRFNRYQSRPIFNVRAFFDCITEGLGHTPIYDESIDWNKLKDTYIVSDKMAETSDIEYESIKEESSLTPTSNYVVKQEEIDTGVWEVVSLLPAPVTKGVTLNGLSGTIVYPDSEFPIGNYKNERCVFLPTNFTENGDLIFDFENGFEENVEIHKVYGLYGNDVSYPTLTDTNFIEIYGYDFSSDSNFYKLTISNLYVSELETDLAYFRGIVVAVKEKDLPSSSFSIDNVKFSQGFLEEGVVRYNEDLEYNIEKIDMTHGAGNHSIQKLLLGIMEKEGMLINVNSKSSPPTVEFFSYKKYERLIDEKPSDYYVDWSNYVLKNNIPKYDTDFGDNYGKINKIGLKDSYGGNETEYTLSINYESKYKESVEKYNQTYKDVENVLLIRDNHPRFEYTNKGLGLVERGDYVYFLKNFRITKSSFEDDFNNTIVYRLPLIQNVNYSTIPESTSYWYSIVQDSVRVNAEFLLPLNEFLNVDLSKPVFISHLGGYYIIEEIEEYVDDETPVNVKLLKVLAKAKSFNNDFNNDFK